MRLLIFLLDLILCIKRYIKEKLEYKKLLAQDRAFLNSIDSTKLDSKKYDLDSFASHLKTMQESSRILLIELNNFHFETIEALKWYLNKLNFNVDIALRAEYRGHIPSFRLRLEDMIKLLKSKEIRKYRFIFFNTMILELKTQHSIYEFIESSNIFGIYHTISDIEKFGDYKNRYFALRDIRYKGITLKGLNLSKPDICNKNHIDSNGEIVFLSIGFPIYHRGFRERLKSLLDYLESKNITNFKFILVGRAKFKLEHKNISFIQNPSDDVLEEILLKAHFIFGIYDRFAHRHYIRLCTSGQRQLSLGYNIPLIINEPFASAFGFSNENAVIFRENSDILEVISPKYYQSLKHNLLILDKKLRDQSLLNLKEMLGV